MKHVPNLILTAGAVSIFALLISLLASPARGMGVDGRIFAILAIYGVLALLSKSEEQR